MSAVWFLTGASRGIGLEIVRQLAADPSNIVIATCRSPATADELQKLKVSDKGSNLHIVPLDVSSEESIRASESQVGSILGGKGIDYLLNNAAVTEGFDLAFNMTYEGLLNTFRANVCGPALIAQVYLPHLEKGNRKVIMNMTSGLASFGLDFGQKNASYTISKTAVNMLSYKQATERSDVIVVSIDPGWVKTVMGGEGAMLETAESAIPLLNFLKRAENQHSGGFFDRNGERVVW